MPLTLNLAPETLAQLKAKAARSGQTIERYLQELAEREAWTTNGIQPDTKPDAAKMSPGQWSAAWRSWAAGYPSLPGSVDDSRQFIYSGRGE